MEQQNSGNGHQGSSLTAPTNAARRTRLRAVYLTDTERDLIVSGLLVLRDQMNPSPGSSYSHIEFAKSFTSRRIVDVVGIVRAADAKATGAA